jgi:type IV pilus assembly protein PilO
VASLSLTKLPWYAQLAVFVVASAALAGGFYYFYEMGQQATLGDKEKELASVRERIQRASATARQLPEFRKQVGDLQARIDALKPILPEERDVGDLLRRVQTLATQSNLKINGFRPLAITTHDLHAEWPISLQLEGTYHNLGLFLDKVSKFPRIINVGSLVLAAKDPPTTATIDITCTATTFVLVEKPPEPPPDETKKKGPAKKTPAPAKKA